MGSGSNPPLNLHVGYGKDSDQNLTHACGAERRAG